MHPELAIIEIGHNNTAALTIHTAGEPDATIVHALADAGAEQIDTPEPGSSHRAAHWLFPTSNLELVCTALDRAGVRWGVHQATWPRLWAERLFAELPQTLHRPVYDKLTEVLTHHPDELATLHWAWAQHTRTSTPTR